ncbi:MAG: carboxypeptidase-like regulatory domain-containing protein, partial [Candidatus Thermoplasmatota archaeon]|nr:carboxypeptidase-like regulatory domain-containing protein [Candidatus Thermoplasmatota archaeon]
MRALLLALMLLSAPLLTGCIGGDDGDSGARKDLESQATVTEETGAVQGVVTDPAIQPVVGATVTILETQDTATTASDGSFAISDVKPGTYTVQVEAEGFIGSENEVTVTSGKVAVLDMVIAHVPSVTPYMQQQEFTGFVECSIRAGVGFAACGAVNLVAGGNATNDRFIFYWQLDPHLWQMVSEIQWDANQPAGQYLSFSVEPRGLPNDGQTEFGSERGQSPLVIRTTHERVQEIDANTTAVCDGEKEP